MPALAAQPEADFFRRPELAQLAARYGVQPADARPLRTGRDLPQRTFVLLVPAGASGPELADALRQTGLFAYVEPDGVGQASGVQNLTPNDPSYYQQWGLANDGTFSLSPARAGADLDMPAAWALSQGDTTVVVAVIDSGCKLDHPEVASRLWVNRAEIPNNGLDDDNDGYVDDRLGWDFAYNDNRPADDYGHGTNVTGIVGAQGNNGLGLAGVDWNCRLMVLKALNAQAFGYYSWWASALYYAADHGAQVVNMSMGGDTPSSALQAAVSYAAQRNVLVVASMGNFNSSVPYYPAAIAGVLAVGATNPNDARAVPFFWNATSGSSYGPHISVVAPGNYIYGLDYQANTNYNTYWGGTSQAAPHVAGLAALLRARRPSLTRTQLRALIETTAADQVGNPAEDVPGWDPYYGHGRVDAAAALAAVPLSAAAAASAPLRVLAYPNPGEAGGRFVLYTGATPAQPVHLRLVDALGRTCWQGLVTADAPLGLAAPLAPGLYTAVAQQGRRRATCRVVLR